jgi:hypothetical protein
MTLKEINELFENKDIEVVIVDDKNIMHSINCTELNNSMIGQMIMLKVKE